MFTGIVEALGEVKKVESDQGNLVFTIQSDIASELKIDQSLSHNGVCLTVTALSADEQYQVVAVSETLTKSNLGALKIGQQVNLERSMMIGDRLDGHIVQGHVDLTAVCKTINSVEGSWQFGFEFNSSKSGLLVEKGSVTVNGVSLTCFNVTDTSFEVAIIPYTFHHTNFRALHAGAQVNLEFDVIGKYVQAIMSKRQ